jgi:hypothetical protein
MNDGMKWRSNPAPGAPLGQFDAQNLPKLEISESALLFSGCNLDMSRALQYNSMGGGFLENTYGKTPSFANSWFTRDWAKVIVTTLPNALSATKTEITLLAVVPNTFPT